jgi:hypothetical protein
LTTDKNKMHKKKEMQIVLKSKPLAESDARTDEAKIHPKKKNRDLKLEGTRG